MDRKDPEIFLEGIDEVIKRDLAKHKELLGQTLREIEAFHNAAKHESSRKRYYYRQIGKGKFDDAALRGSVTDIRTNIRHLNDKEKLAKEKAEHHRLIIKTLTEQLEDYNKTYASLH